MGCKPTPFVAPLADFTVENDSCPSPCEVRFLAVAREADSYRWDFGDGFTSTLAEPTHRYQKSGSYAVTLEVQSKGGSARSTKTVTIGRAVPKSAFRIVGNACTAPCSVTFLNESTNWDAIHWDLGDGTRSTDTTLTRQFTRPGSYTVTLTASAGNLSDLSSQALTILPARPVSSRWTQSFGGNYLDTLTAMLSTPDGGYLLGGVSYSSPSLSHSAPLYGAFDYWVVKVSANGSREWDQSYGGEGGDRLTCLINTPDGGYLLGGWSDSPVSGNKTAPAFADADYWIVKISATGKKEWDRTLGGDGEDKLTCLVATPDGGYLAGGYSFSSSSGNKTATGNDDADFWVIKLGDNGVKQWDKAYNGGRYEFLKGITPADDGGFLLSGVSMVSVYVPFGDYKEDFYVVKISASGETFWSNSYGGTGSDVLEKAVSTPDGGFLLAGTSISTSSGNRLAPTLGEKDYWVVKVNRSGLKQWDKAYGGKGRDWLKDGNFYRSQNGHYVLVGVSESEASGTRTLPHQDKWELWVVELDESGNQVGEKVYGGNALGNYWFTGLETADGGFLAGGRRFSEASWEDFLIGLFN